MRVIGFISLLTFTACSVSGGSQDRQWQSLRDSQASQLRASLYADSDGDGVRDFWDQCRGTVPAVVVNALGCPLDTDGDGRPDYQEVDQAEQLTPALASKQAQALPLRSFKVETLKGFDYDHEGLSVALRQQLDTLAGRVNINRQVTELEVIGHTDSRGTTAYNQALSLRRAKVVHDYLRVQVRDDVLITRHGKGELIPLASNDTAAGRAANRRVEIRTLSQHH